MFQPGAAARVCLPAHLTMLRVAGVQDKTKLIRKHTWISKNKLTITSWIHLFEYHKVIVICYGEYLNIERFTGSDKGKKKSTLLLKQKK